MPVPYFHVVFTLPEQLGPLALQNPRVVYGLLFRVPWETLRDVAANPKHLGTRIGPQMGLHTWGQNLMHHPHIHCVVPGGGLSPVRSLERGRYSRYAHIRQISLIGPERQRHFSALKTAEWPLTRPSRRTLCWSAAFCRPVARIELQ